MEANGKQNTHNQPGLASTEHDGDGFEDEDDDDHPILYVPTTGGSVLRIELVTFNKSPATRQGDEVDPQSIVDPNPRTTTTDAELGKATSHTEERDRARALWDRRFGLRQFHISLEHPEPSSIGRRLGGGGVGIVHETTLDGIPLALKRTYTRRLTDQQLNEIKILGRISEHRHRHIVELIGSYIHRQRAGYELGLLIWPVAQCDLAIFMHHYTIAMTDESDKNLDPWKEQDIASALEELQIIVNSKDSDDAYWILVHTTDRLMQSCGCIASAIEFLHTNNIRHKDLKPSQILLSRHGLWLTDFGWSNDMSEHSYSATSNGDNITLKYQSPERAQKQPCGRAEDIFTLGCIFFEIWVCLLNYGKVDISAWPSSSQRGWSFQANLSSVLAQLEDFKRRNGGKSWSAYAHLCKLLSRMLARDPRVRPAIGEIVDELCAKSTGQFFAGECCTRQGE